MLAKMYLVGHNLCRGVFNISGSTARCHGKYVPDQSYLHELTCIL